MPRRTKEDAAKTRQVILQSALELISEKGFSQTSLDAIAKNAGVTRGAVYWHFQNKNELFSILLKEWMSPTYGLIEQYLVGQEPTLENLKRYMISWFQQVEEDQYLGTLYDIIFHKVEQVGETKALIDSLNQDFEENMDNLKIYLQFLQAKQQISESSDVDVLAVMIHSFMIGTVSNWLSKRSYSLAESSEKMVNMFFAKI